MPLVQVQHLAGAFTRQQQTALIRDITDAFVRVSGEGIRKMCRSRSVKFKVDCGLLVVFLSRLRK